LAISRLAGSPHIIRQFTDFFKLKVHLAVPPYDRREEPTPHASGLYFYPTVLSKEKSAV
jgi:hypothetical protein